MIETERTVLRRFRNDDIEDVLDFMGNPEVMRFSLGGPYDRKQCEEFIQWCLSRYELKGYGLFAVTLKGSSTVVGYCGFYDQNVDGRNEVELGYRLHPRTWNAGLGTEVAYAVQNYGFVEMGFERLISMIEAENVASVRVAEKNGLRHEKDSLFKNVIPVKIYSITRKEHINAERSIARKRKQKIGELEFQSIDTPSSDPRIQTLKLDE